VQLKELIAKLDGFDEDGIICAKRPWSETVEAQVAVPDGNLAVPAAVKAAGFEYFLEVHVAKEVVDVFGEKPATLDEKVRLLIHYADNDAYPDWVYNR
jgi:hypothetical protein